MCFYNFNYVTQKSASLFSLYENNVQHDIKMLAYEKQKPQHIV